MGSGKELARERMKVSDRDLSEIRADSRKRRVAMVVMGAAGAIAGLITGFLAAYAMYYDPADEGGTYPYLLSAAAGGFVTRENRLGILGVIVTAVGAFLLMFTLGAAAYTQEGTAVKYGAWDGSR